MSKLTLNLLVLSYLILASQSLPTKTKKNDDSDENPLEKYKKDEIKKDWEFVKNVEDYIVNFMLYTRSNPNKFYLLQVENELSIKRSSFDAEKDTKILVHGWKNAYNSNFGTTLRDAYLKKFDANILIVDWSRQSHQNYLSSRMDVGKVADVVAQMVDLLVQKYGVKSSSIHILGHSLGAHVAGIAGLRTQTGNVSRITGLDPAAPMFTIYESGRLRADSADFVDVIHTCGDVLGFKTALGQVDFYPNGGTFEQPGCGWDIKGKCSHARSYVYYAESINFNDFYAVKCTDWNSFKNEECSFPSITMGEYTPETARGSYYLDTNREAPFGIGPAVYSQ